MQYIAEENGGNFYYVQDTDKIKECFVDCLGSL
jgi:hypothetical protein